MIEPELVAAIRELTVAVERLRHVVAITGPFGERMVPIDFECAPNDCIHKREAKRLGLAEWPFHHPTS